MQIIGITGNSGVGKTTISKVLGQKLNSAVIDVDKLIIGSNKLDLENTKPNYSQIKTEQVNMLTDSLEDAENPLSVLINGLVEFEIEKLAHNYNCIIVEWMLLPYLKVWNNCDKKILISADEKIRKENYIKNELIQEDEYDKCFSVVVIDYNQFDYDHIFNNDYNNKSLEEITNNLYNNNIC